MPSLSTWLCSHMRLFILQDETGLDCPHDLFIKLTVTGRHNESIMHVTDMGDKKYPQVSSGIEIKPTMSFNLMGC